jgi:hypothetical protein
VKAPVPLRTVIVDCADMKNPSTIISSALTHGASDCRSPTTASLASMLGASKSSKCNFVRSAGTGVPQAGQYAMPNLRPELLSGSYAVVWNDLPQTGFVHRMIGMS